MGLQVPMVLPKTRRFTVRVQVKHAAGMGFVGTGVGWTLPTCAIPVCHPNNGSVPWPSNHIPQSWTSADIANNPRMNPAQLNKYAIGCALTETKIWWKNWC